MANIYYDPESFGVETIAELELAEPCYSFDTVIVQRHKETGKFYINADSGCSCPCPFEDTELGEPLSRAAAVRRLKAVEPYGYESDSFKAAFIAEKATAIDRVRSK